jgi:TolB-like protein
MFESIMNRAPVPPVRINPDTPPKLEETINKALEKERNLRCQSAAEMRADLQRLKRDEETGKTSASSKTTEGLSKRSLWRSNKAIAGAVLAFIVLAAALFIYRSLHSQQPAVDSIAVLPVVTTSSDTNAQFLGDGITDSLIDSLSQLPNLRVMSRSSVFHYKGKDVEPKVVGRELNVKAVLTGRLAQRGDNIDLSTELVNTSDDSHIWGETFNRKSSEILSLQQELAQVVAQRLRVRLSSGQQQTFARQGTQNPEAYALYVRGRYAWDKLNEEGLKQAADLFRQAIEKDPGYAAAYAEMSRSYTMLAHYNYLPPAEAYPKAIASANRATDLDSNSAEAHAALGQALTETWGNWVPAERELRRAIELNPNLSEAHLQYAVYLFVIGKVSDGITEARLAQEIDPLAPGPCNMLSWGYWAQHDYDGAIAQLNKSLENSPNAPLTHHNLFRLYSAKLMHDQAASELERSLTLEGRELDASAVIASYKHDGYEGLLRTMIQVNSDPSPKEYHPERVAEGYMLLGDKDHALVWLDKAYDARFGLNFIKINPTWDSIRSDPRYSDLLHRMGLPQ